MKFKCQTYEQMQNFLESVRYKPEGLELDSRWGRWNFFINIFLDAPLCPWGRFSL